jgi:uncharacterized protein
LLVEDEKDGKRVRVITLGVADLMRSREFCERLGWRRSMLKAEGVVFFQVSGMALALYPRGELAKDANLSEGHGFCGISLAYNGRSREDVDLVLAEAVAAKARILKPAQEAFWGGYAAYFPDLDGFPWEAARNPSFSEAQDGTVRIPD